MSCRRCCVRGYTSYGGKRYHRRARVREVDTKGGAIKTWKRVEYAEERVDEVVLVKAGAVVVPPSAVDESDERTAGVSAAQAVL